MLPYNPEFNMEIAMEEGSELEIGPNSFRDQRFFNPKEFLNTQIKLAEKEKIERQSITRRLMIHKIVLENFKSYKGIREIGPFHKSLTSIVGPNGSGKSNLMESLLFIFGKRARSLRSNKINEVIHSSANHSAFDKASVEVFFYEILDKNHPDKYEILKGSEFSIRRTVFEAGYSRYEINKIEKPQEEVMSLLKSRGIDLDHNRFFILQGEVEQISQMKPKSSSNETGLVEYLEEIVGSAHFKEKISVYDTQMNQLLDQKKEIIEKIRFSESDLMKLNDAKTTAIDFITNEKQSYQLLNIQYQIERYKSNQEYRKAESQLEDIEAKLRKEKRAQKEKLKESEGFLKKFSDLKRSIEENARLKLSTQRLYEDLNIADAKLQNDKKHSAENEIKYKLYLKDLEKEEKNIDKEIILIERKLPRKEKKVRKLAKKRDEIETDLETIQFNIKDSTAVYRKSLEDIENKIAPHKAKLYEIKLKISELTNEHDIITQKKNSLEQQTKELTDKVTQFTESLKESHVYSCKIDGSLVKISALLKESRVKISELKQQESHSLDILHDLSTKLEEAKSSSQDNQTKQHVVYQLLKAQQKKELTGVCGRLGDLATIEQDYDIAISTACPQLDFIVVKKYEEAQKCVEYLRLNKIGKATFIALDKVEWIKTVMMQEFKTPNYTKRIFDLLKIGDEANKIAFYFALRDTLVCPDIDFATKLAFGDNEKKYRVVTMTGEIIELSGLMSGGGTPRKGLIGTKKKVDQSDKALTDLRKSHHEITVICEKLQNEISDLERNIRNYESDEVRVKKEKQKVLMDIEYYAAQLDESTKKLTDVKANLDNRNQHDTMLLDLDFNLEEENKSKTMIATIIANYESEMTEINKKIEDIAGVEYKTKKNQLVEDTKELNRLELDLSKMQARAKNVIKRKGEVKKNLNEYQIKYHETKKAVENMQIQQKEYEDEGIRLLTVLKECELKKEEFEKNFKEFEEQSENVKKFQDECRDIIEKLTSERDDKTKTFKKAKDEFDTSSKKLEEMREKYQESIKNYDFLDLIDEIKEFNMAEIQSKKTLNPKQYDDFDIIKTIPKMKPVVLNKNKKVKLTFNPDSVCTMDPTDDLNMTQLQQMFQYIQEIKLRQTSIAEKLKDIQPDINSIRDFRQKYIEHKTKIDELAKLKDVLTKTKSELDELKRQRFMEFMKGFNVINAQFKDTYQTLTEGGDAELELIDTLDPFSEGINFTVRPPKKKWKQMTKLSGGEKTISSLAFIFALHFYKPTPIYFLDEIDAALDFRNCSIIGNYIKKKTKNAQFIIISLRSNMFELADRLIGIYKTNEVTKTITVNPRLIEKIVDEESTMQLEGPSQTQIHSSLPVEEASQNFSSPFLAPFNPFIPFEASMSTIRSTDFGNEELRELATSPYASNPITSPKYKFPTAENTQEVQKKIMSFFQLKMKFKSDLAKKKPAIHDKEPPIIPSKPLIPSDEGPILSITKEKNSKAVISPDKENMASPLLYYPRNLQSTSANTLDATATYSEYPQDSSNLQKSSDQVQAEIQQEIAVIVPRSKTTSKASSISNGKVSSNILNSKSTPFSEGSVDIRILIEPERSSKDPSVIAATSQVLEPRLESEIENEISKSLSQSPSRDSEIQNTLPVDNELDLEGDLNKKNQRSIRVKNEEPEVEELFFSSVDKLLFDMARKKRIAQQSAKKLNQRKNETKKRKSKPNEGRISFFRVVEEKYEYVVPPKHEDDNFDEEEAEEADEDDDEDA